MNATFLFISNVYSFEMLLEKNNEKKIHSHATKPMRIALRMGKKIGFLFFVVVVYLNFVHLVALVRLC